MAATIVVNSYDGKTTRNIRVKDIINHINHGWSVADFEVEYDTPMSEIRKAIELSDHVDDEVKRKVRRFDPVVLGRTPKSGKLKELLDKGEQEQLPPDIREFLERLSAVKYHGNQNPPEEEVSTDDTPTEEPVEAPKEELEAMKTTISPIPEAEAKGALAIVAKVERLRSSINAVNGQIAEKEAEIALEEESILAIEKRHEALHEKAQSLLEELRAMEKELVELANNKIQGQNKIALNGKQVAELEGERAKIEEEKATISVVKVFLEEDGSYPEEFSELKPTDAEVKELTMQYMNRDEYETFAVKDVKYLAKLMALIQYLKGYELRVEVEYNRSPTSLHEELLKLNS